MTISRHFLFFFLVNGLFLNHIFGVSAYPYPTKFAQPDGDTITIMMKGDEFMRYAKSEDGYTLLYDNQGFMTYARKKADGFLEASEYKVRQNKKRSTGEQNFLDSISPNLFFSKAQLTSMRSESLAKRSSSSSASVPQRAFPKTGSRKLLCILAEFPNKRFTKSNSEVNNLFNQVGYAAGGATGSVRDYFKECSYNQLDLQVDVVGPFVADKNMEYYGGNNPDSDANVRELITEMVSKADPSVDYSIYDNDNDGWIDGLYVIYAGYGEEAGGGANAIWAHAWAISPIQKDGKFIYQYSCSSELSGGSGSNLAPIGVICHEFGHTLGAPDYYDTDYDTGGKYDGTGNWDLQGSGSWNNYGRTPAHPNARTKIYIYNWATVTTLNTGSSVTVQPSYTNKTAFYQLTESGNEYFLIENRRKRGFDSNIPGEGLIIYHGNLSSTVMSSAESNNTINATHPQLFYPVAANATADIPNATPSSYGNVNSSSCSFPGTDNKQNFTSTTTPALKRWDGTAINKPITNIRENTSTGIITFDFMGGFVATPPTLTTNAVTNLAQTSATFNGTVVQGTETITQRGFEWKIGSASTWTKITISSTTNPITYNFTGLTANTAYNVRVYATTAAGTTYGSTLNFITPNIAPPTLTTNALTNLAQTSATFNGTVVQGTETITQRGFEWKIGSASTWTKITISSTTNPITYNLTGLTANTAYNVRAYATTASGTTYGNTVNFTTPNITPPTLTTNAVTNLAQTSATFNGTVVQGTETITQRGFEWKIGSASTWTKITISSTTNPITYNLTGFTANTAYNVRVYATTASGTTYGSTVNFTTPNITPPTLTTNAVTNLAQTSATFNGTVVQGTETITQRGFEWKIDSASTWTKITISSTTNPITYNLTGFTANTAYNVRAYAITASGTTYGNTVNFTTPNIIPNITPPTPITNAVTSVTATSATFNGTVVQGTETITQRGFEWKIGSASTWTKITISSTTNPITYNLTGLTTKTAYNVRAYATTISGTTYRNTVNFTTLSIILPKVTTNNVTNIKEATATLTGTITNGSEKMSSKGFQWKISSASVWTKVIVTATSLTYNLTKLTANTTYSVRAFAVTPSATTYGTTKTFKYTAPILTTTVAKSITDSSAIIGGTINKGSETITEQGIEFKPTSDSKWTSVKITSTNTSISIKVNKLRPNTPYDYRFYAKTSTNILYGTTLQLTTIKAIILGIDDEKSTINIVMHPNPIKNNLSIKIGELQSTATLTISSSSGQIVYQEKIEPSNDIFLLIDMSTFIQGNYYINIHNHQINHTQSVVKY